MEKNLNNPLTKAKAQKNDEFYTQLVDIEKELKHYKSQFRGKVVFCNCDDPYESNFFKYFAMNFNYLGLKKLIATCYVESPISNQQLSLFDVLGLTPHEKIKIKKAKNGKHPHKIEINEVLDYNKDGAIDLTDIEWLLKNENNRLSLLSGNGDFRSDECIELLKQADIVVTNPPFSLFREYVAQLVEYDKKFLIIGNQNNITYKEIFALIRDNRIWLGYDNGGTKWFQVPMDYEIQTETRIKIVNGIKYFSMGSIFWFTNLDTVKRHEKLILYKNYTPEEYPKFDHYNAINIDKVADIPCDYFGAMGVPITFIDKYNPKQFEILNANDVRMNESVPYKTHGLIKDKEGTIKGRITYARVIIKRRDTNEN